MIAIAEQAETSWTDASLLNLAQSLAVDYSSGTTITMPVIFLNGLYNGSASILGVHFTGTPHAFVFKDVVVSVGGSGVEQRYVEQATVVHEIGHAVGLVNNGVPMVTNHEDPAHSAHSTNTDCVMYYAVESSSGILTTIADYVLGNQLNLFAPESLQDARAHQP